MEFEFGIPIGGLPRTGGAVDDVKSSDRDGPLLVDVAIDFIRPHPPFNVDSMVSFDLPSWCLGEKLGELAPVPFVYVERPVFVVAIVLIDGCDSRLEWPLVRLYGLSSSMLDRPDKTDVFPDS